MLSNQRCGLCLTETPMRVWISQQGCWWWFSEVVLVWVSTGWSPGIRLLVGDLAAYKDQHRVDNEKVTKRRLNCEDSHIPCIGIGDFHKQNKETLKAVGQGDEMTSVTLETTSWMLLKGASAAGRDAGKWVGKAISETQGKWRKPETCDPCCRWYDFSPTDLMSSMLEGHACPPIDPSSSQAICFGP